MRGREWIGDVCRYPHVHLHIMLHVQVPVGGSMSEYATMYM